MRRQARLLLCAAVIGLAAPPVAFGDPNLGSWTPVAPMPRPLTSGSGATLTDGRVLVVGGAEGMLPIPTAELYDPTTGAWSYAAPMTGPMFFYPQVLALPDDRALVVSFGEDGMINFAFVYDGVRNTWSASSTPLTQGGGIALAELDGRWLFEASSSQTEIYDAASGASSWGASMGVGGQFVPAALYGAELTDGRVFVSGDWGSSHGASPQIFDPGTDTWSYAPTNAQPGQVAPLTDDHLLMLDVPADYGPSTAVQFFNGANNGWSEAAPLPEPRSSPTVASLPGGRVLVAGGTSNNGWLSSADIFTPPATYPADTVDDDLQIDGTAAVGDTLSATGGTGAFEYQWQRCVSTCVNVGPLTAPTDRPSLFRISPQDAGARLRVVATDGLLNAHTSPATTPVVWPLIQLPGAPVVLPEGADPSIRVNRTLSTDSATVRYELTSDSSESDPLYPTFAGKIEFAPGQSSTVLHLPVDDHGVPILSRQLTLTLSSPVGGFVGGAPNAEIVLCAPDQGCGNGTPRNPLNPLAVSTAPPPSNPLAGTRVFVDRTGTAVAHAATALQRTHDGRLMDRIVDQPDVTRFGTWNGNYPGQAVSDFLDRVQQQEPGTVPMLATYKLVNAKLTHPECGHWADPPGTQAAYHEWITNLAEGIGYRPAVLFLEMDSLITVGCLSPYGLQIRLNELRDAINVLSNAPHLVVYLDAGAADALPAKKVAGLLERAGIAKIQGFFLNSTHFDWTKREIRYGEEISKLTGGRHFVINTAENGQGPLVPKHRGKQGNEVLCNPPGRGLGPLPTTNTGFKNVDAFAWIANPGVSGGVCGPGQPAGGRFSVQLALGLVRHADFKVR